MHRPARSLARASGYPAVRNMAATRALVIETKKSRRSILSTIVPANVRRGECGDRTAGPKTVRPVVRWNVGQDRVEHDSLELLQPRLGCLDQAERARPLGYPAIAIVSQRLDAACPLAALGVGKPVELGGLMARKPASSAGVVMAGTFQDSGGPRPGAITGSAIARNGPEVLGFARSLEARVVAAETRPVVPSEFVRHRGIAPEPARPAGGTSVAPAQNQAARSTRPSRSHGPDEERLGQECESATLEMLAWRLVVAAPTRLVRREGSCATSALALTREMTR